MPVSPPYFEKDALTDKTERFFVSEIIREQILLNYKKEIPYSVEIDVEDFKETEDIIRMRAVIYVARDSQGNHHWAPWHHAQEGRYRSENNSRSSLLRRCILRPL